MKNRKIAISFFSSYFSQSLNMGVNFITKLVLARILFPADFGLFAAATVVVSIASTISYLSLDQHLIRSNKNYYGNVLLLNLSISTLLYILIFVFANQFSFLNPSIPNVLRVYAIFIIFESFAAVPNTYLLKELEVSKLIVPSAAKVVSNSVIAIILANYGHGVYSILWGALVSQVIFGFVIWKAVWGKIELELTFKYTKELLRGSYILFTNTLVGTTRGVIDKGIIGVYLAEKVLGYYYMAQYIIRLPGKFIESAFFKVMFPAFSDCGDDFEREYRLYKYSTMIILSIEIPLYIFLFFNAETIVPILFGPKWLECTKIVKWLSFSGIGIPTAIMGHLVIRKRKDDIVGLKITFLSTVLFTVLSLLLIRKFGVYGVILAIYLCYITNLIGVKRLIKYYGFKKVFFKEYLYYVIFFIVMLLIDFVFTNKNLKLLISFSVMLIAIIIFVRHSIKPIYGNIKEIVLKGKVLGGFKGIRYNS